MIPFGFNDNSVKKCKVKVDSLQIGRNQIVQNQTIQNGDMVLANDGIYKMDETLQFFSNECDAYIEHGDHKNTLFKSVNKDYLQVGDKKNQNEQIESNKEKINQLNDNYVSLQLEREQNNKMGITNVFYSSDGKIQTINYTDKSKKEIIYTNEKIDKIIHTKKTQIITKTIKYYPSGKFLGFTTDCEELS